MRVLIVTAEPCEAVKALGAEGYVGFRLDPRGCEWVSHALLRRGRVVNVARRCEECVFGVLARSGHVLAAPTLTGGGRMRFVVEDTWRVRRALRAFSDQVVSVEEADARGLVLTARQRRVLALISDGAGSIAEVARRLGVSKTAASKLVRKTLRKLSIAHA